mmetsp:Transcript_15896/g.20628  ORF Transcript_15896/g.20628 Transcript_15896/m.20628 type:complete len:838 (+) Transcript_15896:124-2637(+)
MTEEQCRWPNPITSSSLLSVEQPVTSKNQTNLKIEDERMLRVETFRKYMLNNNIDVAVIQCMTDIHWLSGFNTPGAPRGQSLIISKDMIFISSRILEVTNAMKHKMLIQHSIGHDEGEDPIEFLTKNILKLNPKTVGWELNSDRTIPIDAYNLNLNLINAKCNVIDISGIIRIMRISKSQNELALMRRAGEIASHSMNKAINYTLNTMTGATENTIAGIAVQASRDFGGDYAAYPPFICVGSNACLGHYAASQVEVPVQCGKSVFYELPGVFQKYHCALMRTAFVLGPDAKTQELPDYLKLAESCVQAALTAMKRAAVPGAYPCEVHMAGEEQLQPLFELGWANSQRSGYSIGLGFATDWGECDAIMIRKMVVGNERPLPVFSTLHLIPWVTHPIYGAVGLSDTVVVECASKGAVSLLPDNKPKEQITVIPFTSDRLPHLKQAKDVIHIFGDLLSTPTPLVEFPPSSNEKDVSSESESANLNLRFTVFVKDESYRLGQNAFKSLGGGYACVRELMRRKGITDISSCTLNDLKRKDDEDIVTFTTATDGNHGAGLAWAAKMLGHRAVVYLPKVAAASRVQRVADLGGEVHSTDLLYDDVVIMVAEQAQTKGWVVIQDTAWEGYTQVPTDITSAYKVIAHEALQSMQENGGLPPTHVILQVGVGTFAAGMTQYIREALGRGVKILTVESKKANCLQQSIRRGVKTDFVAEEASDGDNKPTWCAGLDCGVVSDIAWPVLRNEVNAAVSISDGVAADGVRVLRNCGLRSGESGAATGVGFLRAIDEKQARDLGLDEHSRVLVVNTEGTTDPVATDSILSMDVVDEPATSKVDICFSSHEIS